MIRDSFERVIDYMRISVTDRCNLRCIYCMPSEGVKPVSHRHILSYEEIVRIVRVAARLGVRKIRITGGEPLIRKNLVHLIEAISETEGIGDVSLTTNGMLLKQFARPLAAAGLRRVNISLDTLRDDRFREMTRGGEKSLVMEGIDEAERSGLMPVKINMVPIRGFNDDEIEDFANMTKTLPYHVRFIEFMPIGARDFWSEEKYISIEEIRERLSRVGPLMPVRVRKAGPARYFRFENARGVVGFISALTHHFCGSCNRLRLTADGKLRPCLFSETEIDLKTPLRSGVPDEEIERMLRLAVEIKPQGHSIGREDGFSHLKDMSKIGG